MNIGMREDTPWQDVQRIRTAAPLVHNITNYVVMNSTANALLAIGASPVMAHAVEEVEEMAGRAQAVVINIGTLSAAWLEAMVRAGQEARRRGIPLVLDPVGSGATQFRTAAAQRLIRETHPAIIRGNASEIRSLLDSGHSTKGVDSMHSPDDVREDARTLSLRCRCVVSVSGPVDLIVEGDAAIRIANGHPMMSRVTGMGCIATAITGAFAAVNPSPLAAAAHAMATMGVVGEMAAEGSAGPGRFLPEFLDVLYLIQESDFTRRLKMRAPAGV
jgi:hydroxyethylthiazole kinase